MVAFLPAVAAVADYEVSFGLPGDDLVAVIVVGFIVLWVALARVNNTLSLSVTPSEPEPQRHLRRDKMRIAVVLTGWAVATLVIAQLAMLPFLASRAAREVSEGHGISGGLFPPTQPASVSWLGEPNTALAETLAHCLMYLGQAAGIVVLFDVDDQTAVRLPTRDVIVSAASSTSPATSPTESRCRD